MKNILFVDDEPRVLAGMQRQFHVFRGEWTMRYAGSGAEALGLLAEAPADVLVTDMMMPGMDGAQLLEQVLKCHPNTIRIVLSGQTSDESVLRLVCPAHQFLVKPCEPRQLRDTITHAFALCDLLGNAELKRLVAQTSSLPSLPRLYVDLLAALRSPKPSIEQIGTIIGRDVAMSAKILQLVNSAFFGLGHRISHPSEAALYLGTQTLKSLVLFTQVFAQFNRDQMAVPGFSLETLWQHCWSTGVFARRMARAEGFDAEAVDRCFVSGLLHDVGKLILARGQTAAFSQALATASRDRVPLWQVEQQVIGASHADVGAYLLGLWNFAHPIVAAVAFHHRTGDDFLRAIDVTAIVQVANLMAHQPSDAELAPLLAPPAADAQLPGAAAQRLATWIALCRTPDKPEN